MATDTLTVKQRAFVQHYLTNGGNATQAYIKAGYTVANDNVANTESSKLLKHPAISSQLMALRASSDASAVVTLDLLTSELDDILSQALDSKNYAVARQCVVDKAKLHGFMVDRKSIDIRRESIDYNQLFSGMGEAEVMALITGDRHELPGAGATVSVEKQGDSGTDAEAGA